VSTVFLEGKGGFKPRGNTSNTFVQWQADFFLYKGRHVPMVWIEIFHFEKQHTCTCIRTLFKKIFTQQHMQEQRRKFTMDNDDR
jgi:hypothetical protein